MSDDDVGLGVVTAPSGVAVLAMAGHLGYIWADIGQRLSDRAATAAAVGGGHIREWLFEAVAVPAKADRPLAVRATTQPSPFDQRPTIAMLEVDMGLAPAAGVEGPVVLGDPRSIDLAWCWAMRWRWIRGSGRRERRGTGWPTSRTGASTHKPPGPNSAVPDRPVGVVRMAGPAGRRGAPNGRSADGMDR